MISLTALIGPVSDLLGKFIEDKDQKNKLAFELATMADNHAQELAKGQLEINKAEAASGSVFKGGWRPAIGWVCAMSLAWTYFAQPFISFAVGAFGVTLPPLPQLDMGALMPLMLGMLGLGSMRSYEKMKGLTK
jgi:hypothetical protein|tara:strand:- start:606 stop:1007 length:402 start_codon:yes stop_codon:yes gene_type:complete